MASAFLQETSVSADARVVHVADTHPGQTMADDISKRIPGFSEPFRVTTAQQA
jgi:hypothetical protein